ncbi:tetratricopeptide repeat protein [Myroides sp. LJL116]
MAILKQELQEKIDALIEQANEHYQTDKSVYYQLMLDAWELYPEPKNNWNEIYSLASELFTGYLEDNNLSKAKKWLNTMVEINDNLRMDDQDVLFNQGKFLFETADYQKAFECWKEVVRVAGYRYFEGEDPNYLKYYRNPDKVNELSTSEVFQATIMVSELTQEQEDRIESLLEQGDICAENQKYKEATDKYLAALELVPSPKEEYDIALDLYVALGDGFFNLRDFINANYYYNLALKAPGALDNGYVWLGLGQSYYELEDKVKAKQALLSAYMLEGIEIFEEESSKYIDLISQEIANK